MGLTPRGAFMKTKLNLSLFAAVMLASGASDANAAEPLHFAITGGYTASFDIDADALPDYFNSTSFSFNDVSGSFTGTRYGASTPSTSTVASIQFYSSSFGGGIGISGNGLNRFVEDGAQLYSGLTASPVFLPGQYSLKADNPDQYGASVLTISRSVVGAVPEPATWSMMIIGMATVGSAMRRRRKIDTSIPSVN
jgi:hypothetical protein